MCIEQSHEECYDVNLGQCRGPRFSTWSRGFLTVETEPEVQCHASQRKEVAPRRWSAVRTGDRARENED